MYASWGQRHTRKQEREMLLWLNNRCTMHRGMGYKCITVSRSLCVYAFSWFVLCVCVVMVVAVSVSVFITCLWYARVRVRHSCTQLLLAVFYKSLNCFLLLVRAKNKTHLFFDRFIEMQTVHNELFFISILRGFTLWPQKLILDSHSQWVYYFTGC